MTAPEEQSTETWMMPRGQSLGFVMILVGLGIALYGLCTVGYPTFLFPIAALIGGVVLLERGWSKFTAVSTGEDMGMDMGMDMSMMDGFGDEFGAPDFLNNDDGELHHEVKRVLEVARATWPEEMVPAWGKFELKDDVLISYGFKATKPGFFTDDGVKTRVVNKLTNAVEASQGSWAPDFDVKTDTLMVTQRSSFPTMSLPPHWQVVHSEQQARDLYPTFEYCIGVDKDGKPIKFGPGNGFPHMGLYGTTGGGKSVTSRALLEQFRGAGFMLACVDGKGTDTIPMVRENGFIAVSSTLQEHIAVVRMVRRIMDSRRSIGGKMAKAGDNTWRSKNTPVLLVLDEFATVVNDMKSTYPKSFKLFMNDIAAILKVGRELRIHVILSTQDMKAETIPSDWQNMLSVNICMGKPDNMTLNKGFPEAIRGEARLKGDTISKKTRGRGIVAVTTPKGVTVELFQSYYSYSPAEDISVQPSNVQQAWTSFKNEVSDRIPKLYSRMWFQPEYPLPDEDEGEKDRFAKQRDKSEKNGGLVDLTELDVADIQKFKTVTLEDKNGVIESRRQFDPLDEDYYIARDALDDVHDIDASL